MIISMHLTMTKKGTPILQKKSGLKGKSLLGRACVDKIDN